MFSNRQILIEKIKPENLKIISNGLENYYNRFFDTLTDWELEDDDLKIINNFRVEIFDFKKRYLIFSFVSNEEWVFVDDGDGKIEVRYDLSNNSNSFRSQPRKNIRFREYVIATWNDKGHFVFHHLRPDKTSYSFKLLNNKSNFSFNELEALKRKKCFIK